MIKGGFHPFIIEAMSETRVEKKRINVYNDINKWNPELIRKKINNRKNCKLKILSQWRKFIADLSAEWWWHLNCSRIDREVLKDRNWNKQ